MCNEKKKRKMHVDETNERIGSIIEINNPTECEPISLNCNSADEQCKCTKHLLDRVLQIETVISNSTQSTSELISFTNNLVRQLEMAQNELVNLRKKLVAMGQNSEPSLVSESNSNNGQKCHKKAESDQSLLLSNEK